MKDCDITIILNLKAHCMDQQQCCDGRSQRKMFSLFQMTFEQRTQLSGEFFSATAELTPAKSTAYAGWGLTGMTHTHTHTCMHAHKYTHKLTHACISTHTRAYACIYAHTHTTHTHTCMISSLALLSSERQVKVIPAGLPVWLSHVIDRECAGSSVFTGCLGNQPAQIIGL